METLLNSLGITDDVLEHLDHAQLAFQRPALLWAGLVLLIPVGYFIYRRQRENLNTVPPRYRLALTATRIVILLLLVIVLVVGVVGVSAYLVVRQVLERLFERGRESFETRVLDELEVLRVRLDRINERLPAHSTQDLKGPTETPKKLPLGPQDPPGSEDAG